MISNNEFVEFNEYNKNFYGTSFEELIKSDDERVNSKVILDLYFRY